MQRQFTNNPPPLSEPNNTQTTASVPNTQSFVVVTDAAYPPYVFKDEMGNAQGFDIDVLQAIGKNQDFAIDVIIKDWANVLPALEKNQSDIAISGMTRTEERATKYLLSNTYAWGEDAIAVKENDNSIKSLQDLANKRTSTLTDTGYVTELEAIVGKNSPNIIAKATDFMAFKELVQGNSDAMLSEKGVIKYYAQQFPEAHIKIIEGISKPDELVIAVSKSKPELLDKINTGLSAIVADGTYAKIYQKWFGSTPEKLPTAQ